MTQDNRPQLLDARARQAQVAQRAEARAVGEAIPVGGADQGVGRYPHLVRVYRITSGTGWFGQCECGRLSYVFDEDWQADLWVCDAVDFEAVQEARAKRLVSLGVRV